MNFDMQMTISELVNEMNNGGNQSELYKLSKINKDLLPYLFRAAGYTREKQKYVATDIVQSDLTIEQLLPMAKELHQEVKLEKLRKVVKAPTVVIEPVPVKPPSAPVAATNVGANINELSFNFTSKEEMQSVILDVLGLTPADLDAIRSLNVSATNQQTGTIYDAVSKLKSRRRTNKTFYVSEEIVQQVQAFTEAHAIKTSQFVEIALLEALEKYGR